MLFFRSNRAYIVVVSRILLCKNVALFFLTIFIYIHPYLEFFICKETSSKFSNIPKLHRWSPGIMCSKHLCISCHTICGTCHRWHSYLKLVKDIWDIWSPVLMSSFEAQKSSMGGFLNMSRANACDHTLIVWQHLTLRSQSIRILHRGRV